MDKEKKRKSLFIQPFMALLDVLIIHIVVYYIANFEYFTFSFLLYLTAFWILISYYTRFYNIYRYTHLTKLLSIVLSQFFIFTLAFFAYFTIFKEGSIVDKQLITISAIGITIAFFKFLSFFTLKEYRLSGHNYRNVLVFGGSKSAQNIISLFHDKPDLGYKSKGFFSEKESKSKKYLGSISNGLNYILENNIDEVFCDVNSLTPLHLKEIREFCNKNNIEVRLIPENKAIYSKDFVLEYFGTIPILKPKQLPFERIETHIIKRIFDLIFSILICFFLLSWLLPILWVFVKIDSKGSFFFKQIRDGVHGRQFYCYKIRSMEINEDSDLVHATKDDHRITKIGTFLRRTSLDELPQFFNVLIGDMSVIGPRPHMNVHTKKYIREIENYLVRNSVKPGITGLAQISGFRGEIKTKEDIENRVRTDIFYIENWSFILDIKIVVLTILNLIKGEESAY